ncbi:MAG: lipoprotein [Litorilinea sp.]|nr:MAG: lipoprotein [Litorilinea sp.]
MREPLSRYVRSYARSFVRLIGSGLVALWLAACTATLPPATTPQPAASPAGFPVTIDNCGLTISYPAPPTRAVTMNQAATEIMLSLGLGDHMVGTAYLDDAILPELEEAYQAIPVLADEYPSQEVLLAAEPDFVYGAYRSAFGDEAAGPRERLLELGIRSYLSVASCEDPALRPERVTFETVYDEIRDIGRIFGASDRAEALVAAMQDRLDQVAAANGQETEPLRVFWFDSGDDEPFAGACCGAPNMILEAAGAQNIFADASGSWATVSWEEVIARDPQAIVVIDAEWSPAQEKIELLRSNPAYATITAVQQERFVVLPFSATTLGVRNAQAVVDLAQGLYPDRFAAHGE